MNASLREPLPGRAGAEFSEGRAAPLVSVRGLKKSYGPTRALARCDFDISAGEIRAILGENGSGKSTLVKILSGVLPADAGEVLVGGAPVRFRSPRQAQAAGVVTVFQETLIVPERSVLDNIFIGTDGLFGWSRPHDDQRRRAAALLGRLGAGETSLDAPVEVLPLERRQIVALARALVRPWRLLILDEATSALDVDSRNALFSYLRERPPGSAVVFISHRMDEIASIADAVTLLQSGETTATLQIDKAPADILVTMISRSRDTGTAPPPQDGRMHTKAVPAPGGSPCLRARQVVLRPGAEPIDLGLKPGQIIGFGGLDGHGQADMLATLAGVHRPVSGAVEAFDAGSWIPVASAAEAVRRGIVYVPRDRKTEGLFLHLSVLDNYSVPTLWRWSRLTFINRSALARRARSDLQTLKTRYANLDIPVSRLSGGNQQKVLLARWLAAGPRVLLLNDPLRGVDAATKGEIYALFRELAAGGVALLLLSSEIEELLELCHTVVVFREGQVSRTLDETDASREAVVAAMFGQHSAAATALQDAMP